MKDFKEKVVVITAFGAEGAKIVLGALHENRLQESELNLLRLTECGLFRLDTHAPGTTAVLAFLTGDCAFAIT